MRRCLTCPVSRCVFDSSTFICGMVAPQDAQAEDEGNGVQEMLRAEVEEKHLPGGITGKDYSTPGARCVPGSVEVIPEPKEPTPAERARHMLTHLPYCSWCPYCVAGRRPNTHHRRVSTGQSLRALHAEYVLFRDPGVPSSPSLRW